MANKTGARLDTMPPADQLTPTEERIWSMKQSGKSYAEISEALNMKVVSIRRRMITIREKIDCHD